MGSVINNLKDRNVVRSFTKEIKARAAHCDDIPHQQTHQATKKKHNTVAKYLDCL